MALAMPARWSGAAEAYIARPTPPRGRVHGDVESRHELGACDNGRAAHEHRLRRRIGQSRFKRPTRLLGSDGEAGARGLRDFVRETHVRNRARRFVPLRRHRSSVRRAGVDPRGRSAYAELRKCLVIRVWIGRIAARESVERRKVAALFGCRKRGIRRTSSLAGSAVARCAGAVSPGTPNDIRVLVRQRS